MTKKYLSIFTKKFGTLFENEDIFESFLNEYPKFEKLVETFPTIINEISSISSMGKSMVDDTFCLLW